MAPDLTALKYTVTLIPDAGVFVRFMVRTVPDTLALVISSTSPVLILDGEAVAEESDTTIRSLIWSLVRDAVYGKVSDPTGEIVKVLVPLPTVCVADVLYV
jgi:hypothetical protein